MFILNANEPKELAAYLQQQNWLGLDEKIEALTKPGEGNMNYVLRVATNKRSFIVKQSREYVEKYPSVPAPKERVVTESEFYKKIATVAKLQQFMPKLIGVNADDNLMVIEDLGNASDFSFLYHSMSILAKDDLIALVDYLHGLHSSFEKSKTDNELNNIELRELNHEHIFNYPFQEENGFDLNGIQNGLQELAMLYKTDDNLKAKISFLGSQYMSNGTYLLHGDFYPASWLKTANGIKIIDPEFCYFGFREFDLGVLKAHLYLTQQDETLQQLLQLHYDGYNDLDINLINDFAGVEIMRRLIGLAQLPMQMDLTKKKQLLKLAKTLLLK